MKYIKKMTALMVLGCFFSLNCSAAGIYNVKYDADLGKAIISGNTAQPNVNVTLEVLKQGNSSDVLKDLKPENASNVILRYDQCMSDDEGAFEFSFKLPGNSASGEYVTRVAWGGSAADNRLVYISPTELTQALYNVNNATDKEFTAAFENAVKKFGLENQYYTELSETEKSFIISAVKENRGSGYESAGDFTEVFSEALAIASVNDIAAGYDALGTVEYFEDILELKKLTSYATFSKQSETVKKQIIEAASTDGRVNDLEAFREKVEEKTVIFSLNNVQGYDEVDEILRDNNHILNIDFTAYNNLSNKSVVNKKMTEVSFTSLNEIVSKFNSFVAAQKKSESSSYHGGGTGGGGGGRLPNTFFDVEDETSTPSKTEGFNDLNGVEWARESIEFLAERNII